MNSIAIGGCVLIVVALVVFLIARHQGETRGDSFMAAFVATLFAMIPVGMLAEHRWNTHVVTEEMTSVVERVQGDRVLLEGEVQMRMLETNVMLERGDKIAYRLTESGRVVVKQLEIR